MPRLSGHDAIAGSETVFDKFAGKFFPKAFDEGFDRILTEIFVVQQIEEFRYFRHLKKFAGFRSQYRDETLFVAGQENGLAAIEEQPVVRVVRETSCQRNRGVFERFQLLDGPFDRFYKGPLFYGFDQIFRNVEFRRFEQFFRVVVGSQQYCTGRIVRFPDPFDQ